VKISPALRGIASSSRKGSGSRVGVDALEQKHDGAKFAQLRFENAKCGATYQRTEHVTPQRGISRFECLLRHTPLESCQSTLVPRYRYVAGPVKQPTSDN
jgi:hypothetical protein